MEKEDEGARVVPSEPPEEGATSCDGEGRRRRDGMN